MSTLTAPAKALQFSRTEAGRYYAQTEDKSLAYLVQRANARGDNWTIKVFWLKQACSDLWITEGDCFRIESEFSMSRAQMMAEEMEAARTNRREDKSAWNALRCL